MFNDALKTNQPHEDWENGLITAGRDSLPSVSVVLTVSLLHFNLLQNPLECFFRVSSFPAVLLL
jgi:hypothetical protein